MAGRVRVLILGGYGTFGGRLARLLADEPRVELLIAGRSLDAARKLCASLDGDAARTPLRFDRDADVETQLRAAAPDIVVDASGPFQAYGESPYRVVEACLAHGAHYLDLADGAGFVRGIAQLDSRAKARGVFVLSGVSTFPVLTAAAVRALLPGMRRIDGIAAGIAPSPYAGVGRNVVRAILGYAGRRSLCGATGSSPPAIPSPKRGRSRSRRRGGCRSRRSRSRSWTCPTCTCSPIFGPRFVPYGRAPGRCRRRCTACSAAWRGSCGSDSCPA